MIFQVKIIFNQAYERFYTNKCFYYHITETHKLVSFTRVEPNTLKLNALLNLVYDWEDVKEEYGRIRGEEEGKADNGRIM